MLHNEARELLVKGYEKSKDAGAIAQAYSVSERTVYRLAQQKRDRERGAANQSAWQETCSDRGGEGEYPAMCGEKA